MKCPICNENLVLTSMSMCLDKSWQKENYCIKCRKRFSDEELKDAKEIEFLDEDTEIWKESKRYD